MWAGQAEESAVHSPRHPPCLGSATPGLGASVLFSGPRGHRGGCQPLSCRAGPAYTCLEAATGRALLRQHMDVTGEEHPLNKLRVKIEPGGGCSGRCPAPVGLGTPGSPPREGGAPRPLLSDSEMLCASGSPSLSRPFAAPGPRSAQPRGVSRARSPSPHRGRDPAPESS